MVQSAALGLAIAGALALGYANIFVTAPSPENLKTLFEFAVAGLEQMGYKVCTNPNRLNRTRSSKRPHICCAPDLDGSWQLWCGWRARERCYPHLSTAIS